MSRTSNKKHSQSVQNFDPSGGTSSLIQREREEIKRMKERGKKELEQMMEYELKLEKIREENERKLQIQKTREKKLHA